LIASAKYLGNGQSLFDNNEGYGRVQIETILSPPAPAVVQFVDRPGIKTGALDERAVQVTSAGTPLRVVLAYSDFPGARLVNNLNLIVRGPNQSVFVGNGRAPAAGGFDADNNVEVVHIPQPAPGAYRVQVVGANVPRGPQPFALVIVGAIAS
jgi:hypothetical protein